jgi:hypothetical protein
MAVARRDQPQPFTGDIAPSVPASAQIRLRGQVLNLRTGAIRVRLKDSIQSVRDALIAPSYLPFDRRKG